MVLLKGLTERFNHTFCEALKRDVFERKDDWDRQISPALLAYRVRPQSTTKKLPFEVLYGRPAV